MKILLAPSETKKSGGEFKKLQFDNFEFCPDEKLYVSNLYNDFLKSATDEELSKLFGIKKISDLESYKNRDLFNDPTMKAIERYTGVAYDYLDYPTLNDEQKEFIDNNLIIFSNIFGALKSRSLIPNYKLKQAEKIDGFKIESYYKEHTSDELDRYFEGELLIDLRAGFYDKFYTPKVPYITMKFIKAGKVVSHWAKAYRGKITRELAKYQPQTEKELNEIEFKNLFIKEILSMKNKKEYVFEIKE
jgi:cytoplasmic iron level regulating protein YaaA (DUF328/UPF0246 family)